MVVQHNLTAMTSNRMLGLTSSSQAKSTEKLSSGYKINRAADDAAGLSISEKMRKQIRGLTQASANAQDGISAVQTAEGALTEVQDMLQRMNELAVKAANGTNSESDRSYIQNEIDQLTTEIDRVSETTKFNETYLLKGDKDAVKDYTYSYRPNGGTDTAATVKKSDGTAGQLDISGDSNFTQIDVVFTAATNQDDQNELVKALRDQGIQVEAYGIDTNASGTFTEDDAWAYGLSLSGDAAEKFDVTVDKTNANKFVITNKDGDTVATITIAAIDADKLAANAGKTITAKAVASSVTAGANADAAAKFYDRDGNGISENALSSYFAYDSATNKVVLRADAPDLYDAVGNKISATDINTALTNGAVGALQDLTGALTVTLHVGADATSNNQITMNIDAMSAKGLGVNGLRVDGVDDSNALGAIETIKEAIQKVSTQRSALGAVQNRLEHTISNLDNVVENTTSAESQIRDTDMATEMVKYSNNNILAQAGQAMLAQANQANQGVLSLLG